jgi:ABC-2 type transport system permease protein
MDHLMNHLGRAVWAEALKARRSRMPGLTALAMALAPLVGGLFMLILRDPDWARRAGLIATKAQLRAEAADWPTYFGLLGQAVALGGLIVFGLVVIWVVGREYSDGTVTDVLVLPTPRGAIVGAKFMVIAAWSAVLMALVYALGVVVGAAVGLPGWSLGLAAEAASRLVVIGSLTVALVCPFAWAASIGRGYLAAIGAMFLAIVLAQIIAALGWGAAFPWSVPALASGLAGPAATAVGGSYVLVVLTGGMGIAGTAAWWRWIDQA